MSKAERRGTRTSSRRTRDRTKISSRICSVRYSFPLNRKERPLRSLCRPYKVLKILRQSLLLLRQLQQPNPLFLLFPLNLLSLPLLVRISPAICSEAARTFRFRNAHHVCCSSSRTSASRRKEARSTRRGTRYRALN